MSEHAAQLAPEESDRSERQSRRSFLRRGLAAALALTPVSTVLAACAPAPSSTAESPTPKPAPTISIATTEPAPTATAEPAPTATAEPAPTATAEPAPTAEPRVRFAVIGDYGMAGEAEAAVAAQVLSWAPDFIATTGDNNYPSGAAESLDRNVGQYYHAFISPYKGSYGRGGATNRFWPTLGNHDWDQGNLDAYLDYFTLPGNGRYYTLDAYPVRLHMVSSHFAEPDGYKVDTAQANWLRAELAASTAAWNLVLFHHSPYTSSHRGEAKWMRWPFGAWGAHAVLSGHDHAYERLEVDELLYFVNGLGGGPRYAPDEAPSTASQFYFNADWGAMRVEATPRLISFSFITQSGETIDSVVLEK
ncbi:MAG: alkaline phosphatase [Oscillochloris sp.]|nr:alkaline phosphatase [Oscillochloris sp.]